jgi:hypothetical protein
MSLTYGYDLKDGDDFMTAPIQASELVSRVVLPGAVLVNHLPFCAFLLYHSHAGVSQFFQCDTFIHGFRFSTTKPLIRKGRELSEKIKNEPIDFVKNAMVRGGCAFTNYFD